METTVAALLLVTASVLLACVVVNYAVNIFQVTLTGEIDVVNDLEKRVDSILNSTKTVLDENIPPMPDESLP